MNEGGIPVNLEDNDKATSLHASALAGQTEVIRKLVRKLFLLQSYKLIILVKSMLCPVLMQSTVRRCVSDRIKEVKKSKKRKHTKRCNFSSINLNCEEIKNDMSCYVTLSLVKLRHVTSYHVMLILRYFMLHSENRSCFKKLSVTVL